MGRCVRPSWQRHEFGGSREVAVWGQPWRAEGFPNLAWGCLGPHVPPVLPHFFPKLHSLFSRAVPRVTVRLSAEEQLV